ncbi:uncharacterized protein LOC129230369 [Uloborus diversus]|uniref:uncharacterized protein LOC129230369 n=1 Tax=Uloborus diversus TaxID=327109 RepID=UPI002409F38F|nr:uncharacterized protein LOC129230369 [Uloborus diversus]
MSSEPRDVKKTKGRVVASRYKQAADDFPKTKATPKDGTFLGAKSRANETTINPSFLDSATPRFGPSFNMRKKGIQEFTSTPMVAVSSCSSAPMVPIPSCSHISLEGRSDTTFSHTNLESTRISKSASASSTSSSLVSDGNKKQLHQLNSRQQEEEIDVLYAQYLQAAFQLSQAKSDMEKNSKCALEKYHKMWRLSQVYLHNSQAARKCLSLVQCLLETYELLKEREKVLKSVVDILPTLRSQYEKIATAVDSVRHQLLVKNVCLPSSDCEGEQLTHCLNEVCNLLSELMSSMHSIDEINSCAINLASFASNGESLVPEIERCLNVLEKLRQLLLCKAAFVL